MHLYQIYDVDPQEDLIAFSSVHLQVWLNPQIKDKLAHCMYLQICEAILLWSGLEELEKEWDRYHSCKICRILTINHPVVILPDSIVISHRVHNPCLMIGDCSSSAGVCFSTVDEVLLTSILWNLTSGQTHRMKNGHVRSLEFHYILSS